MGFAFHFVEVIIVLAIVSALSAIALTRLNFSVVSNSGAETTANKIVTDLRRVRRMAISDAAENPNGFELRFNGSVAKYDSYDIIDLDTSSVIDTHEINDLMSCSGASSFIFGPLGNLISPDTQLTISTENTTIMLTIVPATGMVKCSHN